MSEFGHEDHVCFSQQRMRQKWWSASSDPGPQEVSYVFANNFLAHLPLTFLVIQEKDEKHVQLSHPSPYAPTKPHLAQGPQLAQMCKWAHLNQLSHKHMIQDNKWLCSKPLDLVRGWGEVGYAPLANGYGAISLKISWNAKIIWRYLHVCFPLFLGVIPCILMWTARIFSNNWNAHIFLLSVAGEIKLHKQKSPAAVADTRAGVSPYPFSTIATLVFLYYKGCGQTL